MSSASPSIPISESDASRDRRREPRLTLVTKAVLFPDHSDATTPRASLRRPCKVFLCNISYFGVGFRSPSQMQAGERYDLKVEAGPVRIQGQVEVMRCREHDERSYEIGARFVPSASIPMGRAAKSIPRNPSQQLRPQ